MSRTGPGGAPVLKWHEDNLVAAQCAAVPGAVLADHHAIREAGQGAGRKPAQAERSSMPAEREIWCQGRCDQRRVLRHPVVDGLAPVAIGPAVETAVAHRSQIVGRRFVAETVALVDDGPQVRRSSAPTPGRPGCAGRKRRCGCCRSRDPVRRCRPGLPRQPCHCRRCCSANRRRHKACAHRGSAKGCASSARRA